MKNETQKHEHATQVVTDQVVVEDITLTGAGDESALVESEDISLSTAPALTDDQIEAVKEKFGGQFKRAVFVGVVGGGGLGVAVEHERGYWPVPPHWYMNADYHNAMDYAMKLNQEVFGISEDNAHIVIASTMRGAK